MLPADGFLGPRAAETSTDVARDVITHSGIGKSVMKYSCILFHSLILGSEHSQVALAASCMSSLLVTAALAVKNK